MAKVSCISLIITYDLPCIVASLMLALIHMVMFIDQ